MVTTTNEEGARTSGVTRFISWPLDDRAFQLDIIVESYMGMPRFRRKWLVNAPAPFITEAQNP
jgi:hypothetical protein